MVNSVMKCMPMLPNSLQVDLQMPLACSRISNYTLPPPPPPKKNSHSSHPSSLTQTMIIKHKSMASSTTYRPTSKQPWTYTLLSLPYNHIIQYMDFPKNDTTPPRSPPPLPHTTHHPTPISPTPYHPPPHALIPPTIKVILYKWFIRPSRQHR